MKNMDNKNEGFYTTGGQKDDKQLELVINKLETLLAQIKNKDANSENKKDISKALRKSMDKTTEALKRARKQARMGMDKTTDAYKQVKGRYDKTDPAKQKLIIVGLSAALASLVTAIGLVMCFTKRGK